MTTVKLIANDGSLYTPQAAIVDDLQKQYANGDPILLVRYDAGDCDTINWPKPNSANLAQALYDSRKMGLIPDVREVLLPDGTEFSIDGNVQ